MPHDFLSGIHQMGSGANIGHGLVYRGPFQLYWAGAQAWDLLVPKGWPQRGLLPSPSLISCSVGTVKPVKLPGSLGSQIQVLHAFEAVPGPPGFPVRGWVVALSSPRTSPSQSQTYS